jgi:hypothetical protein
MNHGAINGAEQIIADSPLHPAPLTPQQNQRLTEILNKPHPLEKELAAERDKVRTLTAENRRLKAQRKELRVEIEILKNNTTAREVNQ